MTGDLLLIIVRTVEWFGIAIIVVGLITGTARFLMQLRNRDAHDRFRAYRADIGRGILVGLEVLVAADIIATVAIEPTLDSLAVLAGIVAIRTFLSLSLEVEVSGRWPWQQTSREVAERQNSR
ncbi:putative membrane protein [Devosia subaequoris]|uniref:Putative membrane protein n=1 Tax=Devosia subaequoris TaxID=395930 RepID=A0A7W6IM01_9HYPH|nr:DUF1622 domain-containing protein [Devosia subaequoris]MBB4051415.1 putative membrane protein [Devosia subaequoris]MCP1209009.1 DUF1622 domain-containing protein [Devosia subaequoris]